jgi:putative transposase
MANTYSRIYIQTVFSVSNRMSLIKPAFKEDLYKYITGIVTNQGQKLIAINGMADHIHHSGRSETDDGACGLGAGCQV